MKTAFYQPRTYRARVSKSDLVECRVVVGESDLSVRACIDVEQDARRALIEARMQIEDYIHRDIHFLTTLLPYRVPAWAPPIIQQMARDAARCNVGPMAAVAGALSEAVARYVHIQSPDVIVENGGDVYMLSSEPRVVALYAGCSPLSMKYGLMVEPSPEGVSVCTSSGTVGHSLSFGRADAVVVISRHGSFADAAATAIGNMVQGKHDITAALSWAQRYSEILGVVIITGNNIGLQGRDMQLCTIDR